MASWGHREAPGAFFRAHRPQTAWSTEENPSAWQSPGNSPGPGPSYFLLSSTWYFLIALGKTLVTTKQAASLSRPVWSVKHNNTEEGRGQMKVTRCQEHRIVTTVTSFPSQKARRLASFLHGLLERTGQKSSSVFWDWDSAQLPQAHEALPGPALCCSWRPRDSAGFSSLMAPSNSKYKPPVLHGSLWFMSLLHPYGIPHSYPLLLSSSKG